MFTDNVPYYNYLKFIKQSFLLNIILLNLDGSHKIHEFSDVINLILLKFNFKTKIISDYFFCVLLTMVTQTTLSTPKVKKF